MSDRVTRGTVRRAAVVVAVAAVAAAAGCAMWGPRLASDDLRAGGATEPSRALRLFASGDTEGFLGPCGCVRAQYGGLPRRAAYLNAVRRPGDVCIDLGNLLADGGPSPALTMDAALEGLRTLGCDALVPAESEIRMGEDFERAAARNPGLDVVCANLRRADGGGRAFEPWIVRRLPDGRAVAVVGVAEPFDDPPALYRIAPAEESVRTAISELGGRADAVVVAGGVSDETATALAAKFPDVTLVVGGNSARGSNHVLRTAGAPVMLVGDYGWHVGRVEFDAKLRVADSWLAWLDNELPDDPDVAGVVARWKAAVSQENAGFAEKLVASLRDQHFAGSESCAACHAAEFATWKASGHSHAMPTLAGKGAERDPLCISCHLHDVPPGADSSAATLALGVGCEACHGGAARHADLARRGSADAARALSPATRDACARCHVPPNAARIDFDAQWPRIAHGRGAAK